MTSSTSRSRRLFLQHHTDITLLRKPKNEVNTLAVFWKLTALGALPFGASEALAYSGKGTGLAVHSQEDEASNPER